MAPSGAPKSSKGIQQDLALPAQGKAMEPHIADRPARRFGDSSHPVERDEIEFGPWNPPRGLEGSKRS